MAHNFMIVVAIDFGTAYSGYAFSFSSEFKRDPLAISVNQAWNAGSRRLCSVKTPTCLLLDKEKTFVAFGYEAEDKYAKFVENGKHKEYFCFENFKMSLHNNPNVSSDMQLTDINKKKLPALDVFSHSIKYLKDHFIERLDKTDVPIHLNEIRYVLTVPAIWTDRAKELMRKSAEMAGISPSQLLIALEPEAASIYYQYRTSHSHWSTKDAIIEADIAGKYMIVDLGGGTADITVHERCSDGTLKEISRADGDNCGGFAVNHAFMKMLDDILEPKSDFDDKLMEEILEHYFKSDIDKLREENVKDSIDLKTDFDDKLREENLEDYIDLVRDLEMAKRRFQPNETELTTITFPCNSVNSLCKRMKNKSMEAMIKASSYSDCIYLTANKMRCSAKVMSDLFEKTKRSIIKLIEDTLERSYQHKIHHIILVGGFAECLVIQDAIKQNFQEKKIIIPIDCGLSVLQGAVLFGHKPEIITVRVTQFTYGIQVDTAFDPIKHDQDHLIIRDGKQRCKYAFSVLININTQVKFGEMVHKVYQSFRFQEKVSFKIICTINPNPIYADTRDCQLVGNLTVEIPEPRDVEHDFKVKVTFGKTEIHVEVEECQSGKKYDATFSRLVF